MNEVFHRLTFCILGAGALFFTSCQKREDAPPQSPPTPSKLFLEQQKSVGPKLEWHREVIAVRPHTFRFVVAATKPVSVSLVSDSVLQPLLASNAQLEDGQAIHTQDSDAGSTETTITVQPGKYWILITNRSDETANIDLKCYH